MHKKKTLVWGIIIIAALLIVIWGVGNSGNEQQASELNSAQKTEAIKANAKAEHNEAEKIYNEFKTYNGIRYMKDQKTTFTVMKNGNNFKFYSDNRPDGFYVLQRHEHFKSQDDKYDYEIIPVKGGTPMGTTTEEIEACFTKLKPSNFSVTFDD